MNLIINQKILSQNLITVSRALSTKNIIPVLAGIKLELTEEGLYLIGSDDDITIQTFIKKSQINSILLTGTTVLPGKYILEIIKKLPEELITIKTDGSKVLITTTNAAYNLNTLDSKQFPNKELLTTKTPVIIKELEFKEIINQTSFAVSHQESRPILTGINFNLDNNKIEIMATDSYRLSKKIHPLSQKIDNKINIVIPGKNLIELMKILNNPNKNIEINIFNNNILFKFNNTLFQSRLLNGTYPNVNHLLPDTFNTNINLNAQVLYEVLDRVSLLSEKDKSIVQLKITKQELIFMSNSLELGNVEEKILITTKVKDTFKISFNAIYMMEALKVFNGKEIELLFNDEISPIIIKEQNNSNLIQLILPIKTY